MKKVLSVLLAGAMTVAMAVPAFAASSISNDTIYDSDGKTNDDVSSGAFKGWTVSSSAVTLHGFTIDGVVPNAELYIPLAGGQNATLKSGSTTLTASNVLGALGSKATLVDKTDLEVGDTVLKDTSFDDVVSVITVDTIPVGAYSPSADKAYKVSKADVEDAVKAVLADDYSIDLKYLVDDDYFKFDYDKDDGGKYVKKIEVVDDKKLGDLERTSYLKITLNESTTTSDLKSTGSFSFKAKKDSSDAKVASGNKWTSGKEFECNYTLWINNVKKTNDDDAGTGDRIYFDPDDNEDNTLVWGDDRAALFFEANDDANKFYARLQTKSDSEIYSTYGDPVNADLWFFDFVGNPTIPATSRATLTLGIPWDEDDDYTPNPEDCFIYEKDADGNLVDVTSKFTYDADNDGTTEIEGWTIKTRTLGTYIISDTELDTTVADDVDEEPADDTSSAVVDGGKEIPNTGSSDMVGVAVVAAVVSLAAAGAVAFKKASK